MQLNRPGSRQTHMSRFADSRLRLTIDGPFQLSLPVITHVRIVAAGDVRCQRVHEHHHPAPCAWPWCVMGQSDSPLPWRRALVRRYPLNSHFRFCGRSPRGRTRPIKAHPSRRMSLCACTVSRRTWCDVRGRSHEHRPDLLPGSSVRVRSASQAPDRPPAKGAGPVTRQMGARRWDTLARRRGI